jgi:hypothetical protein
MSLGRFAASLIYDLADIDIFGSESGFAVVEIELPKSLNRSLEAERHDLIQEAQKRCRHSASVRA